MALPLLGRNAKIDFTRAGGSPRTNVPNFTSWSLDVSADEIDASSFGTTWGATAVGLKKWRATLEGNFDNSADHLDFIRSLTDNTNNTITTIKLYVNSTNYWGATDSNGVAFVNSVSLRANANGLISLTVNLVGIAPITYS